MDSIALVYAIRRGAKLLVGEDPGRRAPIRSICTVVRRSPADRGQYRQAAEAIAQGLGGALVLFHAPRAGTVKAPIEKMATAFNEMAVWTASNLQLRTGRSGGDIILHGYIRRVEEMSRFTHRIAQTDVDTISGFCKSLKGIARRLWTPIDGVMSLPWIILASRFLNALNTL